MLALGQSPRKKNVLLKKIIEERKYRQRIIRKGFTHDNIQFEYMRFKIEADM